MQPLVTPIWNNPYLRFIILIIAGIAVGYLLYLTSSVWTAFLIAFLLANLLNPALHYFSRHGNRAVGMLALIGILLVILALIAVLGLYVSSQLSRFSRALPVINTMVAELPYQIARRVDPRFDDNFVQVYQTLKTAQSTVTTQVTKYLGGDGQGPSLVSRIGGVGGQIGVIFILTIYLLYGFPNYVKSFTRILPHRYRGTIEAFASRFAFAMGGYIRGQIIVGLISGFLVFLAMLFIGVPLAPVIGIVYGVANFIPYFGPIVAAVPTVFLAFLEGGSTVVLALLALVIVNQIDGNILSPYIFSKFISIDPVTVIIALLVGGALFGFIGIILSIPVAAFLKIMISDYYVDSKWYKKLPTKTES
jgi:predicted PurR-regulated permease PerM